jgi:predicted TIM-barrel fold metal-dependent hydrolase
MTADHAREALIDKLRLMQDKGMDYPSWVLDQAGVDVILVNMPSLGPGQNTPRFLCVPRADGFLFPFGGEDGRSKSFRKEVGLENLPANLNEYKDTIRKQLGQWKTAGAPAIKFAIAYHRPLDFAEVSDEEAIRVFEGYRQAGKLSSHDAKILQDFLFRFIAYEAGQQGLVVQIHTGIGAEPYFNIRGSNPMLLETMFNNTALRQTRFVMVHGGWPFEREAGAMLIKPNVYADFSAQVFLRSTEALSQTLRDWLEWYPEKILFGTDSYSEDTPLANWEEKLWLATRTARQALALALTRMMRDGQITRPRAEELARMVLRDNAVKLYGLKTP